MADAKQIYEELSECKDMLIALGDENRLYMILQMLQLANERGVRVGEITANTHLSRPAVSHHLKILKDSKLLKVRKVGTKNYYYFDMDMESFDKLISALVHAKELVTMHKEIGPAREDKKD